MRKRSGPTHTWTAASAACRSTMASCSASMPMRPSSANRRRALHCAWQFPTSKISWAGPGRVFLFEMVSAFLGSTYPTPPRMLCHTEEIVKAYLVQEMFGPLPPNGEFSVFATEGGTAAMTYIFQSLRANGLIKPGDKIGIARRFSHPIWKFRFSAITSSKSSISGWTGLMTGNCRKSEIDKLSTRRSRSSASSIRATRHRRNCRTRVLDQLAALVAKRHDLFIVTDDVYGTFADDFVSSSRNARTTRCVSIRSRNSSAPPAGVWARLPCMTTTCSTPRWRPSGSAETSARQALCLADHDAARPAVHRPAGRRQPRGRA
jgi:hypothetical protein